MRESYRQALKEGTGRGGGFELAAPSRVPGFSGRRSGRGSGNALEFSEYREYRAGDDLRRLDWSVYARSEQLMVKLYHEEIDPRCDILLDCSASMAEKAEPALALAALLAQAAVNSGFSLEVWHAAEEIVREPQPQHPPEWGIGEFDAVVGPGESLAYFAGRFQVRGLRIAVTDLLWPQEPDLFLGRFAVGSMAAAIIQLTGTEESFEGAGNTLLVDAETGEERELFLDEGCLARYRERLARHFALWERKAQEHGVRLIRLKCSDLYPEWKLQELFRAGVLK